jgi:Holliday junction DNA helicase RuvA
MIGYLKGKIQYQTNSYVVINCGGVGYRVEIKEGFLKKSGETVEFFIYTHVRENELRLFGFDSEEELMLFEMLLDVNGVGPKAAISIVSALGSKEAIDAILVKNAKELKVPGVGIKTANKIILELSEKLAKKGFVTSKQSKVSVKRNKMRGKFEQAAEALESLGYSSKNIEKAVDSVELTKEIMKYSVEELVKYLLKQMR